MVASAMILLFTDFGLSGPYIGQMEAAIFQIAPTARVINLFADAPGFNPQASACLLAAYMDDFPAGSVFLTVVDPGVGSNRKPVVATIDGKYFVGPDNGLFDVCAKQAAHACKQEILWRPDSLSASFHGRDLFAPLAAHLDCGNVASEWLGPEQRFELDSVKRDLHEVIYIDHYGNAMTGVRALEMPVPATLLVNDTELAQARTFSDVPPGQVFWYENSNSLVEIAVNCGSAAEQLCLTVGTKIEIGSGASS
jgi:S-adenosylmethionine hydrolase